MGVTRSLDLVGLALSIEAVLAGQGLVLKVLLLICREVTESAQVLLVSCLLLNVVPMSLVDVSWVLGGVVCVVLNGLATSDIVSVLCQGFI